jgi:hypothetical protein
MAFAIALLECAEGVQLPLVFRHFVFHENFAQFGPFLLPLPSAPSLFPICRRMAILIAFEEADWLRFLQTGPGTEEMLPLEGAEEIGRGKDAIRTLKTK